MKNRSKPQKPTLQVPVLTEIVHMADSLEQETVPGALIGEPDQPDQAALTPAVTSESAIAQAVAKWVTPVAGAASPPPTPAAPVASAPVDPLTFDHYIPQTASGFASGWWMDEAKSAPAPTVQTTAAQAALTQELLVKRVLAGLDRQVSEVFETRLREVVAPALLRLSDALLAELRHQLTLSLRDMVTRAVAVEVARHANESNV
jgi:hypothetical protein